MNHNQGLEAELLSSAILVVDDMALMRQMIGMALRKAGFSNVSFASDGDEALEKIAEDQPDLVVLDINMPKMSGYDVCRALRAQPESADLPILVQSASEAPEERVEVFAVGATDFVSKPINQPELIARVKMHLENRLLIKNLTNFETHMRRELAMARDMQHSLLPDRNGLKVFGEQYGLSVDAIYRASFELGGDLWGCWPIDDTRFGVFVLDMTGHGVGSALNTFRAHAVMGRLQEERSAPATFLTALNAELQPALPLGQFATMFYGVIDQVNHSMTFAGAGAPRPLLFVDGEVTLLDSSGYPVGISSEPGYEEQTVDFPPGASLFCYSDVLLEGKDQAGEMLGEDGFVALASKAAADGFEDYVARFLKLFFAGRDEDLDDDLTAVLLHAKAPKGEA